MRVTIPKSIAARVEIGAGDVVEWAVEWVGKGDEIRLIRAGRPMDPAKRGWRREDLYGRARPG